MNPKAVAVAQLENLVERINSPDCRRAERDDDRGYVTLAQFPLKRIQIHPPTAIRGNRGVVQFQHGRDSPMRVVSLVRSKDSCSALSLIPAFGHLPGNPERLEIGDGAARSQVPE